MPVREAVRLLEAEGLVRFTRNVGAEVLGMNTREYAEAMETVAHLEGAATALAAPLLSRVDLARARELNEQMRECRRALDPVRFTALNLAFHRVLCAQCPNGHLSELLEREWERLGQVRRSTFFFVPDRPNASVQEHDALLRAHRVERPGHRHRAGRPQPQAAHPDGIPRPPGQRRDPGRLSRQILARLEGNRPAEVGHGATPISAPGGRPHSLEYGAGGEPYA